MINTQKARDDFIRLKVMDKKNFPQVYLKKIIAVVIMVCFLSVFIGCGDDKVIKGKLYETYGLLSDDDAKIRM